MNKGVTMKRSDISTLTVLSMVNEIDVCGLQRNAFYHLCENTGAPPKVVLAALNRDADAGYLEYGLWVKAPWLTEKGKEYLL